MKILFRADASLQIGSGHIMRCLTLAKKLRDWGHECAFVCRSHQGHLNQVLADEGFEVYPLSIHENNKRDGLTLNLPHHAEWLGCPWQIDAEEMLQVISEFNPQAIIVDHYSLDIHWEESIQRIFKGRFIVIDDLADRKHHCHLLIDQTLGRERKSYSGLVNEHCVTLLGTKYAFIRDEFIKNRGSALSRRFKCSQPRSILITMGGVDQHNVTETILGHIRELNLSLEWKITVVLGQLNPYIEKLKTVATSYHPNVQLVINSHHMAVLMTEHDIAVGAIGGTTWERSTLALPTLNIVIAENQRQIASALDKLGIPVIYNKHPIFEEFNLAWSSILNNYQEQVSKALTICDGLGISRMCQEIDPIQDKKGRVVTLEIADNDAIEYIYKLQCLPETRKYARNPNIPTWDEHKNWMTGKLHDANCYFYIIKIAGTSCGSIRIDKVNDAVADKQFEISLFIEPKFFGCGIASAAVKIIMKEHCDKILIATVLHSNLASNSLFNSLGFSHFKDNQYIWKV